MACALATLLIAATSVVLRLISRGAILRSVGPEDWFMIAALVRRPFTCQIYGL